MHIVILSARGQERDKVRALDIGADDYLTKPFGVEELLARVRAVLRRSQAASQGSNQTVEMGQIVVDFDGRRVTANGEHVHLTPTEFNLLAHLARDRPPQPAPLRTERYRSAYREFFLIALCHQSMSAQLRHDHVKL